MLEDPRLDHLAERLSNPEELRKFLISFVNRSLIAQTTALYYVSRQVNFVQLDGQTLQPEIAAHFKAAEETLQMMDVYSEVYGEVAWPAMREMLEELIDAARPDL